MFTIADWIIFGVAIITSAAIGYLFGFLKGIRSDYLLKINTKEDYEEKVKELDAFMAQIDENMKQEVKQEYKKSELFAPGAGPELGLPRELK